MPVIFHYIDILLEMQYTCALQKIRDKPVQSEKYESEMND